MKKNIFVLGFLLLLVFASSCREESDMFNSYTGNNSLIFEKCNSSYEAQFEVFWHAMDQYYGLWDYEKKYGLDWDEVYKKFLPQFKALDKKKNVTDAEYEKLLKKLVSPIHDGHTSMSFLNIRTKNKINVCPSDIRNKNRDDFSKSDEFVPSLEYYSKNGSKEIVMSEDGDYEMMEEEVSVIKTVLNFMNKPNIGLDYISDRILLLTKKDDLSLAELQELSAYRDILQIFDSSKLSNLTNEEIFEIYNDAAIKYAYLNIPGFDNVDVKVADSEINLKYALFNGNIPYLYISEFHLSFYLDENSRNEVDFDYDKYSPKVKKVWNTWFKKVQELHKQGKLGGVIIDLRSNGGGLMDDFRYVLGSLLQSGTSLDIANSRVKQGVGRFDYSPLIVDSRDALGEGQEGISEPIVILTNCRTTSMSEITSLAAKQLPNGKVIGKRTWGGLCGLSGASMFSETYTGHIGEKGVTPVYVYLPCISTFALSGECMEGVGVYPDIEVDLDELEFELFGRDAQLERALKYIRTGN